MRYPARVREIRAALGLDERDCPLVPGWFADTLPRLVPTLAVSGIAWLRIDCDWYDPVRFVLDTCERHVVKEGVVLIDDYYAWDGCAQAVHDCLSTNDLAYRLRQVGSPGAGVWFVKRPARIPGGPA